ncbi:hypothetical protein [Teichococcus wenyumeiae]|uniref:hypothetical protein n=1 Tax=Teichococcus wenyumeiae TaxID=2478470 RepID=UPI0013144165|nr:hypothetical protein [Pseudoroseomonas wenyumeiae]
MIASANTGHRPAQLAGRWQQRDRGLERATCAQDIQKNRYDAGGKAPPGGIRPGKSLPGLFRASPCRAAWVDKAMQPKHKFHHAMFTMHDHRWNEYLEFA